MSELDEAWENFLEYNEIEDLKSLKLTNNSLSIPKASNIYISTKTKISYLNCPINLYEIFWKLKVIDYHIPEEGIIKKQIKINSLSQDELDNTREYLKNENYIDEYIINHIDNPNGRIKFKDIRKISIGICKKDILSYRCKKKSAFYNCFVIILRVLDIDSFKEIHVKVFNTGKLEIPGIQNDNILDKVLILIKKIFIPLTNKDLDYDSNKNENVLINSNFNCGFYLDREKLFNLLRFKYYINSCYDPCSYPGIQCEFYYDINNSENNGQQPKNICDNIIKISFMIFRTGSVLIVGKCNEIVLYNIYNFIKELLYNEFYNIVTKVIDEKIIEKNKKSKKKIIFINKLIN